MNSPIFSTPPLLLDVVQHVEAGLVGTAVRRAPQAGHAGRDRRERVGAGRCAQPHGRGRRVLLVVGVQDEDAVHRAHQHVVDLVVLARRGEHHAHEVAGVRQVVARVHVGLAHGVLVGHRDQRRHLGDQPDRRDLALPGVVQVHRVRVERRQRADQAGHDRHRVRIAAEAAHEELHLLVDHRVVGHALDEIRLLLRVRQLAVQQQVAGLEVVALRRQLLDRVAAVQQLALVAVDVGDGRIARRRRQEARVVGELAGLAVQRADVDDVGADGALVDRQLHRRRAVGERQGGLLVGWGQCHGLLPGFEVSSDGPEPVQDSANGIVIESAGRLFAPQQKVEKFVVRKVQEGLQRQDVVDRQVCLVPVQVTA